MAELEQYIRHDNRLERSAKTSLVDVPKTIELLEQIPQVEAPQSKRYKSALKEVLSNVTLESPLKIYVGSCPDYSHENGSYTHQNIGEGVPLLSQVHVENDVNLLKVLDTCGVPYEYVLMVADVEAIDEVFSEKFTNGDQTEFLRRCVSSSEATQGLLDRTKEEAGLNGDLRSSSFFMEFGYDNFLQLQNQYMSVLFEKYEVDESFRQRITNDIAARMAMYKKMYDKILPTLGFNESQEFLVYRDIRTKAQYLTLGRAISHASENAMIINHPTANIGLFNDRNKHLLPSDGNIPQKTLPVFEMKKKVY